MGKEAVNDPNYERLISDHSHRGSNNKRNDDPHIQYWSTIITRPLKRAKLGKKKRFLLKNSENFL